MKQGKHWSLRLRTVAKLPAGKILRAAYAAPSQSGIPELWYNGLRIVIQGNEFRIGDLSGGIVYQASGKRLSRWLDQAAARLRRLEQKEMDEYYK